ncbi:unnamed protein product [Adineta steineri]|uniref:F-box domain-containing protein n=1 Tax=Adineta steineri TaxID=433720 RepID=A0A813QKL2_9BILA|nr:unnamed protein product [Adineta steineri]CAF3649051.1 unnamed protein product [Adineta steineri]
MNQSDIHLLDLPDELLLAILKKLSNIDVLYSLLDVDNNRLAIIAQDKIFTNTINLTSIDEVILNRFCKHILSRIHHNIQYLILESSLINRVFHARTYPKLTHLKLIQFDQDIVLQFFNDKSSIGQTIKQQITDLTLIYNDTNDIIPILKDYTINVYARIITFFENLKHLNIKGSSITAYPGVLLYDLPSTIFSSSILTKLCINVATFNDCLYLLDGRLNQLNSFTVRVYDVDAPSLIVHNKNNLLKLKYFSLTCHSHIYTYDNRIIPLLHRMLNLEQLVLCLTVRNRNGLIDGTHLQNEILIYMPFLKIFTFDIRTWNIINGSLPTLSNDDIQQTFSNIRYRQIGCTVRYFLTNSVLCHVFTLPFTFDYLQCLTNHFPNVSFNHVLYLSICDISPFEHEFFIRLSHAVPLLKHLTVTNSTAQICKAQEQNNNQSYLIVEFKYLNFLSVMNSDISYTEQFLLDTRTYLPCLTELRINYEYLKTVTDDFTREATRLNCSKIKRLITEVTLIHSNDLFRYFPLLSN